jgi:hypothetical protein
MKKSINILILLVLISCQVQEKLETNPGTIKFSMQSVVRNEGGRITETPTPASVLISIEDESGNTVEDNKKLTLYSLGQGFVSESLQLIPGSYKLTQFMILDENDIVIYATPQEGSELAEFVNDPLPIEFTISEDENTLITPQVLAVQDEDTPESFGFASFGFEVVEPRLAKVIITEPFGTRELSFVYENNLLRQVTSTLEGYPQNMTTRLYDYFPDGKLKKRHSVNAFGDTTHYFVNEYSGDLLIKRKYFEPGYNQELEYFYDAGGQMISMIQRNAQTLPGRLHEFIFDEETSKLTEKLYLNASVPGSLRFIDEFFLEGKKSVQFPITGIEELIDFYGYPLNSNITGLRQIELNSITGDVISEFEISIEYEYNSLGLPVKATVSNPDGWYLEMEDGTVIEFFYE